MIDRENWRQAIGKRMSPRNGGVHIGDGWKHLVCDLIDMIDEVYHLYNIIQIKEKCGVLRFYVEELTGRAPETVYKLIDQAEEASKKICELCGADGKLVGDSWKRALCNPCNEHFVRNRNWRFT